jgi:hypothetical protein
MPPSGRARDLDYDDALSMLSDEDAVPADDRSGLDPIDDVPEIKPIDISDQGPIAAAFRDGGNGKSSKKADPGPGSSAVLEPLGPEDGFDLDGSDEREAPAARGKAPEKAPDKGRSKRDLPPPSGELEPLDPGEALAILGQDDPGRGKKPSKKSSVKKALRGSSSASKLVPLSASDEDFDFLDERSSSGRSKNGPPPKKTDPFARARRALDGSDDGDDEPKTSDGEDDELPELPASRSEGGRSEGRGAPPAPKKRTDPFAKAARALADDGSAEEDAPPPPSKPARSTGRQGGGGGGRVVEGDGDHGLVLSRIASEPLRQKAAELIAEIKGIPVDEALKLTDRTIIPVLKGVSREVAELHLERFKKAKISGRVTTRQKDR